MDIVNVIIAVVLASVIAIISLILRYLNKSGAAAIFILAVIIYSIGTWKWTVPILTFFILSSFLSKIRLKKNESIEKYFEKTGVRDAGQVFANGGVAGFLVLLYFFSGEELIYISYIASLAAVCADTWGTEIGTLRKAGTYNIVNFERVEQGTSGGISMPGILGSILGASVIAFSGLIWINHNSIFFILIVILSGFTASLIDSILGASVQVQYKCNSCGKIIERKFHCDSLSVYFKGVKWFGNDLVNFVTAASGALLATILYRIII